MAQVRITDEDDVERATVPLVALEKEQQLRTSTLARVTISRDDLNAITGVMPGRDRVYIEDASGVDTFGGILRTPGRSGARPTLLVDGFEEYMARAQQVPLGQQKVGADDSTLVQECIDATPQLSAGTLETVTGGESWIFSGVSQLAKARTVEEAAGGELVFNPDRSVDYLSQRGSDKTATTLSPANGSFVESTFNVDRDGRAGAVSHLQVYGVGQGSSQVTATIVPEDDTGSYPNKVTYTNPDWGSGDGKIWNSEKYTNKDVKNVSALQAWGLTLIADLQSTRTLVSTVVKDAVVELGDEYHVSHPEEGVDETLRAVEVTELIRAAGGSTYEVVFSNHSHGLDNSTQSQTKDQQRYQSSFEGDLTAIQQGPGRGPVGPNHDYFIHVFYPDDVVHETNASLLVVGTNYRAFSQGASSGGDHTHSVSVDHPSHTHDVTIYAPDHKHNTFREEELTSINDGHDHVYEQLYQDSAVGSATEETETSDAALGTTTSETSDASGGHTHTPNPGLLDWDGTDQSPEHYPEDVDVVVNGSSQGTALGDGTGEFETAVDLGGVLSTGWNTIRLTSVGLGHLSATYSADLFRQSL